MSFGLYRRAGEPFNIRVRDFQRSIIRGALRKHHGNQVAAAKALGLHRNVLSRYCNSLGIDPSAFYRKSDHERYQSQHGWRAAKIAEGLCANCFKNKAGETVGGERGTETCCGSCAKKKRERENRRYRRTLPKSKHEAPTESASFVEHLLKLASVKEYHA